MKRCYELAISAGKKGYDTFGAVEELIAEMDEVKKKQKTGVTD